MKGLVAGARSRFARGLPVLAAAMLLACAAPCAAAETTVTAGGNAARLSKVVEAIQRHYQTTDSFAAKFVEQITPVGVPARTREGMVYFRKPGRMRWEFNTPNKELVVSDGSTLYSYDPGLNQVVEAPLKSALRAPGATEFLLGVGNIKRDFTVSEAAAPPHDGFEHVRLVPRKGGDTIEVAVDPKSGDIRSIRVIDQLGDITDVHFSDIRNNVSLQDSLFSFRVPAGADIVRPEGSL